jgi:hypothetical protein
MVKFVMLLIIPQQWGGGDNTHSIFGADWKQLIVNSTDEQPSLLPPKMSYSSSKTINTEQSECYRHATPMSYFEYGAETQAQQEK